jgi:hypothetical protein
LESAAKSLQLAHQLRHGGKQVGFEAIVGDAEDRRFGVFVDDLDFNNIMFYN